MSFRKALTVAGVVACCSMVATVGAAVDGGATPGVAVGSTGPTSPDGKVRYVTFIRGTSTLVAAVRVRGGTVARFGWLRGLYGIPVAAFDGTVDGLTRDGGTLVVASTALGPRTLTRFSLIDTRTMKLRRSIALRGTFAYDALSPDGRTVYLIESLEGPSYASYRVRAYDLAAGRLLPRVIADRREVESSMSGSPVARATARGGAWVYTLYAKQDGAGFVHALDARNAKAVCIDLPWKNMQNGLWSVRVSLSADGSRLVLSQPRVGRLAIVDTRTYRVSAYRAPATR